MGPDKVKDHEPTLNLNKIIHNNNDINNSNQNFGNINEKNEPPETPTTSFTNIFPGFQRRFSRDTTCSSTSSLYEMNMGEDSTNNNPIHDDHLSHTSSFLRSYDINSTDDDETDIDDDILPRNFGGRYNHFNNNNNNTNYTGNNNNNLTPNISRAKSLFKKNWDLSGTISPTFTKQQQKTHEEFNSHFDHYFSENAPPSSSSTPIFKRLVSKNSLKPQLKSFRRITNDLFHESLPLENEINHENLMLLNLKEEEDILNDKKLNRSRHETTKKKTDIIKMANETWSLKKNSNVSKKDDKLSNHSLLTGSNDVVPEGIGIPGNNVLKKRSFESDSSMDFKRRAVSTSPVSSGFFKRSNFKIMNKASTDLEKMSLR
ncbi:hypothetical protein WICMUC_001274 [Wickerhamomyces mucosus]|uniref:Uncharacterized protein n=1 Tax=Wickerhamomyces mucosus TaxID=1378264 RepID=A0A9P8PVB0_9ASCO|nr:hypothetical protein WICMUC_001274 [Wickerhamomyces mucosus]